MINSVADYIMLDMTGKGRYVTGNILPVREGGAKRALKYEDILFLKEGKLERQNWTLAANAEAKANKVEAPSRWLRKDVFESAVCSGTWRDYRDAEKEITEGLKNDGPIEDIVGEVVALGNYEAGRALKLERLEKAYENMGKLRRTMRRVDRFRTNSIKIKKKWKEWYGWDYIPGDERGHGEDEWVGDYAEYNSDFRMGSYPVYHGEVLIPKSGSEPQIEERLPYAKRAWVILSVSTYGFGANGEWYVKECDVTRAANGQSAIVRLINLNFEGIVQEVLSRHGGTYYTDPQIGMRYQSVRIDPYYLLIEHDFPATAPVAEE